MVNAKHAAAAFSGEGAAKFGGRWNLKGVAMVYTSATRSLAALEILVHLNPRTKIRYEFFRAEFDDGLVETLDRAALPPDWNIEPPSRSTGQIGKDWTHQARSAILAVPSIIVPDETNYLLNPAHPDFKLIKIGKPEPFDFDQRLLT